MIVMLISSTAKCLFPANASASRPLPRNNCSKFVTVCKSAHCTLVHLRLQAFEREGTIGILLKLNSMPNCKNSKAM